MTTLTDKQIASVAAQAGFKGSALTIAVAVALAESSGRTDVVNSIGATGLWQILQSAHPQWTIQQLKDPHTNARAAYIISSGGKNWKPWVAYTSGSYRKFLDRARKSWQGAMAGVPDGPNVSGPDTNNPDNWDFLTAKSTWVAVGLVVVGLIMIIVAVVKLTGKDIVSVASNLIPEGKILDAIKAIR